MGNSDEKDKLIEELRNKEKMYKSKIENLENKVAFYNEPILVGLNNIGACSYMNATLQCLLNSKKLTEYFLNNFKNDDPNKIMANEYYEVILNLCNKENNKKSYSPYSFKEKLSKQNPSFEGIAANDSKDLINFLLERLHQELNITNNNIYNTNNNEVQTDEQMMLKSFLEEVRVNFNSPISGLFYGISETKSQCKGCNITRYNFEVFSFLEFPLEQINQYSHDKFKKPLKSQDGKNSDVNLYECFEYNQRTTLMAEDNQIYCKICNKSCDCSFTTFLYTCPNYLIINLNRGKGAVYECNVIFPEQLNLSNYVVFKQNNTIYELYAVICHLGPSSMVGHFVAYCKNRIDNQWYLYNDALVALCTKPFQYSDGKPYILFYKSLVGGA